MYGGNVCGGYRFCVGGTVSLIACWTFAGTHLGTGLVGHFDMVVNSSPRTLCQKCCTYCLLVLGLGRGDSVVRRMNEVTVLYIDTRLVLGWVTVFGRVYYFVM